jgi:hypothetical protein
MSLLDDTPYDLDEYQSQHTQSPGQLARRAEQSSLDSQRRASSYTDELNQGVKDKANLLGDASQEDPASAALSARARQHYEGNVNQILRSGEQKGVRMELQAKRQDLDLQSANFANAQTRAQIGYQELTFARAAAINQEIARRQLYGQLFGGIGLGIGTAAALGAFNAAHRTPSEMPAAGLPSYPKSGDLPANASGMVGMGHHGHSGFEVMRAPYSEQEF